MESLTDALLATPNGLLVPTLPTLRKYGGTPELWFVVAARQGFVCGACGKLPTTFRLVIDHQHVRGWKNMVTSERWQYVRGLLCWTCNGFRLARGATVENLRGAAAYLEAYEQRRARDACPLCAGPCRADRVAHDG